MSSIDPQSPGPDPEEARPAPGGASPAEPVEPIRPVPPFADWQGHEPADEGDPGVVPIAADDIPYALPAPRPPHPSFWWSILWCLLFLFVTQLLAVFIALPVVVVLWAALAPDPAQALQSLKKPEGAQALTEASIGFLQMTSEIFVIGFSLLIIRLAMGRTWRRQIALRRPSPVHVVLALVALPGFVLLGEGSYNLAGHFVPSLGDLLERIGVHGVSLEKTIEQFEHLDWWFAVLVIGVGPGVGEELWCRGFLGRGMVGNYGVVLGVLLTSFWFGFIHLDPPQGLMAMLMGIGLHYAYLTTRSLWVPMLLHFGNNSLEIVSPKVPWLRAFLLTQAQAPYLVYPTAVLLVGTVALALYRSRARLVSIGGGAPPWRPDYPGVELPPPGSGTVVAHRGPGALRWALVIMAALLFVTAVTYALQLPPPPQE